VRAQSTKLAAIAVPEVRDSATRNRFSERLTIRSSPDFRAVMMIGAVLAVASAVAALVFIDASKRGRQVDAREKFLRTIFPFFTV